MLTYQPSSTASLSAHRNSILSSLTPMLNESPDVLGVMLLSLLCACVIFIAVIMLMARPSPRQQYMIGLLNRLSEVKGAPFDAPQRMAVRRAS